MVKQGHFRVITPPAVGRRSFKFTPFLSRAWVRGCVSVFTPPAVGEAESRVSRAKHGVQTQFPAEYVNKTRILTCMLEYLNRKKVLRAKILVQNVLKRQIPPRNFTEERCIAVKFLLLRKFRNFHTRNCKMI